MSDHTYEQKVWLDERRCLDFGTSYGVCDLSYSQLDEAGNLEAFFYVQTEPETMARVASEAAAIWVSAKSFHDEVVAHLRAGTNGATPHDADGEA